MNWDDLRIFVAVARAGQIGRASVALGIDATTVGRRLRRLEAALGTLLFEREREGQRLTEAGARLAAVADTIDGSVRSIGADDDAAPDLSGLVRISVAEGFGTWFVARHLPGFARRHPGIRVDLVANNGFRSPSKRETDIAILLAQPRKGPLKTRKLTDYQLGLYGAHDYLDAAGEVAGADDLRRHRLIGYIPDFIYAPELDYLGELTREPDLNLRSSSINAQAQLAAAGGGLAILPCFIGAVDPRLRRVLPGFAIRRSFWLAVHEGSLTFPRTRCFVDWLVEITRAERALLEGGASAS